MPTLISNNAGSEGKVYPLGSAMLLIGRAAKAALRIEDAAISKNHASIVRINGEFLLRDKGSTNGTFVNGKPITEKTLSHNDLIRFGPYQFQVDLESPDPQQSLPGKTVANLRLDGQEYARSVILTKAVGKSQNDAVQIMIAGKALGALGDGRPQANYFLVWGLTISLLLLAGLGYMFYAKFQETAVLEDLYERNTKTIESLKKQLAASSALIADQQTELAKAGQELSLANDSNKKAELELGKLRNETYNLDASKQATQKTTSSPNAFPVTSVEKPPAASQRPAAKLLPLLEFPEKVNLVKDTSVPLTADGKIVGSIKLPKDKPFVVTGIAGENVRIEFDGKPVEIPKANTDFLDQLKAANSSIRSINESRQREQDALNEKDAAEKALAAKQVDEEMERLASNKTSLSLRISESTTDGLVGTVASGPQQGVKVILSGVDPQSYVPGELWSGEAYPMGIFKKSEFLRYRQYTTKLDEYVAFKRQSPPVP